MLIDYSKVKQIYIVCGKTDMRKSIDGLASTIQDHYNLDVFGNGLFLFCGGSRNKYKALYWEGDGFIMLYKRLENGVIQWPPNQRRSPKDYPTRTEMAFRRFENGSTKNYKKSET